MDFDRELMQAQGHGRYEPLDKALLPSVYVAYRKSLSEGTEVFHNNIRARFEEGDPLVVNAMKRWAAIAAEGRQALAERDYAAFDKLIDENFDLRASIYKLGEGNLQMVRTARAVGATAKFAGSGGAIVGTVRDADHLKRLTDEMAKIDVAVIKPKM
jgi:glucuronokinase